jgi:hypothetical protein
VAIKKFGETENYEFEKKVYEYLKSKNLEKVSMKLLGYDDDRKMLVIERGACDLLKFAQLRR